MPDQSTTQDFPLAELRITINGVERVFYPRDDNTDLSDDFLDPQTLKPI